MWSGVAGHYRIYFCYSIFQFSRKIRLLLSNPKRCVLLSGRYQAFLPTIDLQPDGWQTFTMLPSARRYLQAFILNSIYFKQAGIRRRILGSCCYSTFYRGHEHICSDAYWHMMRLHKIWAEGSFPVLKREYCLSKVRKRGIPAVTKECLLSAMALNLKRMVRAILFFLIYTGQPDGEHLFSLRFIFCQQPPLFHIIFLKLSILPVATM